MGRISTIRDRASLLNLATGRPFEAAGRVRIDLTDPVTGKVKERVAGKNHVFTESLLSASSRVDWWLDVSTAWLCLNDNNDDIDMTFPYLLGQTTGYGIPSTAGTGLYRGAYSIANQVLEEQTATGIRWKFQYDFTTAQANGTIGSMGLTQQYMNGTKRHLKAYKIMNASGYGANTGRYKYACSNVGIVTKLDLWNGAEVTIDVSAIVGTTTTTTKQVGYAPATGRCYVYCYSSTSGKRYMYEFSDDTFSTLLNTYPTSNITINESEFALYIHGNIAYWFGSRSTIIYANFVNNTAQSTRSVPEYNNAQGATSGDFGYGMCLVRGTIVANFGNAPSAPSYKGIFYDLSSDSVIGFFRTIGSRSPAVRHPLTTEDLFCLANGDLQHGGTISAYKLPSPVTKTSSNGMTATYELEVNWA